MQIQGKVQFQNFGTGFWGIIGEDGQNYRPKTLIKALQKEGLRISAEVEEVPNQFSVQMWGKSIIINSHTILPA